MMRLEIPTDLDVKVGKEVVGFYFPLREGKSAFNSDDIRICKKIADALVNSTRRHKS